MRPEVRTESGVVSGTTDGEISVFKGIPYAAPLDGARRFQEPVAPEPWQGVRAASACTASVPQTALPGTPAPWSPSDSTESLSVNVWSPDLGGGLPVMVWIHGGAYLGGTSAAPEFDAGRLAGEGVVVVTLNYRVGFEGFGWVADAPPNRGILDQLSALRWVRDNIFRFGGDPDNVTIFGESAGATSVVTLVASPSARGLFRRAIAQSVGRLFVEPEEARRVGELITGELGVAPKLEELAGVPSKRLQDAQSAALTEMATNRVSWSNSTPYAVTLDDELLPQMPWEAMRAGAGADVDLISGFTTDEGRLFTLDLPAHATDPAELARGLRLPPSMVEDYRVAEPGLSDAELYQRLMSDQLFRMPTLWCAEQHGAAGGRAYLYEFAWASPMRGGALGACHGIDVPFTFGVADSGIARSLVGSQVSSDFETLSAELRAAWTSFAATGDPGWPRYETTDRLTRVWDVPSAVRADTVRNSRLIWRELSGS